MSGGSGVHWRVGTKVGVTVYRNDVIVGMMLTPELAAEVAETMDEIDQLLALQRARTGRAVAHWRLENPRGLPNVEDVTPDLGELVEWLMKKAGLL